MKRLSLTVALLLCLSSGCVYFNTFYNAKRRFDEAEKQRLKAEENPNDLSARRTAGDIYSQAITKASAILDLHPDSKYVDDSLMIIGKAEFWREHYLEALRKFAELQSNFPKSELLEESHLWEGRAYWKMGQYADARRILLDLAREGRSFFADQAAFALLEVEMEQKDYSSVIKEGEELLTHLRTGKLRAGIYQKIGGAQVALARFDVAEEALRNVLKHAPSPRMEYEARTSLGAILEARGVFAKARDLYAGMLRMKHLKRGFEADIRLNLARTLFRTGQEDEAYRLCKGVTEGFPRTPQAAMAYYQMGLIAQRQNRKPEETKELFRKAQQEDRNAPAYELARQRQEDLEALERYLQKIASDSTGALDTVFDLAELYRQRLNEPDSALVAYRRVAEKDTTKDLGPKAMYAIGWIYTEVKQDSASAREAFASLVRNYPGTAYAEAAASWLHDGTVSNEAARARFLEAERLRFSGAAPGTYLPILEQIVSDYPGDVYAAKALYAVAWTHENALREEAVARERYQEVAERYGNTAVGDLARQKLEAIAEEGRADSLRLVARAEEGRADSLRLVARADSLREAARADSIPARVDSLKSLPPDSVRALPGGVMPEPSVRNEVVAPDTSVQSPRVAQTAPLVYPDSLKVYPTEVQVTLKVLVGKDGRVKEGLFVRGPYRYYEAALATVRQYTFIPGARDGQPEEMWVEQIVEYLPP